MSRRSRSPKDGGLIPFGRQDSRFGEEVNVFREQYLALKLEDEKEAKKRSELQLLGNGKKVPHYQTSKASPAKNSNEAFSRMASGYTASMPHPPHQEYNIKLVRDRFQAWKLRYENFVWEACEIVAQSPGCRSRLQALTKKRNHDEQQRQLGAENDLGAMRRLDMNQWADVDERQEELYSWFQIEVKEEGRNHVTPGTNDDGESFDVTSPSPKRPHTATMTTSGASPSVGEPKRSKTRSSRAKRSSSPDACAAVASYELASKDPTKKLLHSRQLTVVCTKFPAVWPRTEANRSLLFDFNHHFTDIHGPDLFVSHLKKHLGLAVRSAARGGGSSSAVAHQKAAVKSEAVVEDDELLPPFHRLPHDVLVVITDFLDVLDSSAPVSVHTRKVSKPKLGVGYQSINVELGLGKLQRQGSILSSALSAPVNNNKHSSSRMKKVSSTTSSAPIAKKPGYLTSRRLQKTDAFMTSVILSSKKSYGCSALALVSKKCYQAVVSNDRLWGRYLWCLCVPKSLIPAALNPEQIEEENSGGGSAAAGGVEEQQGEGENLDVMKQEDTDGVLSKNRRSSVQNANFRRNAINFLKHFDGEIEGDSSSTTRSEWINITDPRIRVGGFPPSGYKFARIPPDTETVLDDRNFSDSTIGIDLSTCSKLTKIAPSFMSFSRHLVHIDMSGLSELREIGDFFLARSHCLENIDLTELAGLTTIGDDFLTLCPKLKSVKLGSLASLTKIGRCFLAGCENLDHLEVSEMPALENIGERLLAKIPPFPPQKMDFGNRVGNFDFSLFPLLNEIPPSSLQGSSLIQVELSSLSNLAVIASHCLQGSLLLEEVTLSRLPNLERIDPSFAAGCPKLVKIQLEDLPALKVVNSEFCFACSSLQVVDIIGCSSLVALDSGFLSKCEQLNRVCIDKLENLQKIAQDFCSGCKNLEVFENSEWPEVREIGGNFFSGCEKLNALDLSTMSKLEMIGSHFLHHCFRLESLALDGLNPNVEYRPPVAAGCGEFAKTGTYLRDSSGQAISYLQGSKTTPSGEEGEDKKESVVEREEESSFHIAVEKSISRNMLRFSL